MEEEKVKFSFFIFSIIDRKLFSFQQLNDMIMKRMKSRYILLSVTVALIVVIGVYLFSSIHQKEKSSFIIRNASITYDTQLQAYVLDFCVVNTGNKPVYIDLIKVYKDTIDKYHYIGMSVFVETTSACNRIFVLYGSNPVPPKHEAWFRATGFMQFTDKLKPGTYIIEVKTKDKAKAFYSISFEKKSISMSILNYKLVRLQQSYQLKIHLRIKNTGEIPVFIPDDVKVYLDGKSWNAYSSNRCIVLPQQTGDTVIETEPIVFIPCNNLTNCTNYIVSKEIINMGFRGNVPSMLKSHKVTIEVANSQVGIVIPPLKMSGRIIDIRLKSRIDATGKTWVNLDSIKLKVNYSWITTLDAGWFNKVIVCVDNLCEKFTPSKVDAKAINANESIVELSNAGTYPAEKGNKVRVLVYYGDLLVAQADLT